MVFEIQNAEQAKKVLNFIVENDFNFRVDDGDAFSIYLKSEIGNMLDNIYYDEDENLENIDIDKLKHYVVDKAYNSMICSDWSDWNDWVYNEIKTWIEEYLGGKR